MFRGDTNVPILSGTDAVLFGHQPVSGIRCGMFSVQRRHAHAGPGLGQIYESVKTMIVRRLLRKGCLNPLKELHSG